MFYDMLNMDISAGNLREFEQTAALFEQKLNSMTTVQKYWHERLMDGRQLSIEFDMFTSFGWEKEIPSQQQYEDYCQFAKKIDERNILGQAQFGINIINLCPKIKKKKNRSADGNRVNVRVYPDLDECRKAFEALVKSSIDWS